MRSVIALATTTRASRKFFTRTVDLPTVTLKLLTGQRYLTLAHHARSGPTLARTFSDTDFSAL